MMFDRRDVEFDAESGLRVRGWLFAPEKARLVPQTFRLIS
jgi:hypothetical protein